MLDRTPAEIADLATEASSQGWMNYKAAGGVVEITFPVCRRQRAEGLPMNRIDLLRRTTSDSATSWDRNVAGAQRVWLAVYDKEDERKLRLRLGLFEEATHQTGHKWMAIDLTDAFADWMCGPDNASLRRELLRVARTVSITLCWPT